MRCTQTSVQQVPRALPAWVCTATYNVHQQQPVAVAVLAVAVGKEARSDAALGQPVFQPVKRWQTPLPRRLVQQAVPG